LNLRIAYLCGEYPTATNTFIQREIAGLRESGIHVDAIAVRQPKQSERGGVEQHSEREQTTYVLPASPWRLISAHGSLFCSSPARYLRAMWLAVTVRSPGLRALVYQLFYFIEAGVVAAHMKRMNLSHLHNHTPDASGYVAMIVSQLGGFSYSLTIHGFGILSEPNRWRLKEKLERSLYSICVSWHARSQAMLWTDPKHWEKLHVVHCGVDPKQFERLAQSASPHRLLFVGRLHRVKGLPLLLEAVATLRVRYPSIFLDVVGDGPERRSLEELVRELGIGEDVAFHGYCSQAGVSRFMSQAGVFVMTSFAEGVPVVLMEAMASGVPVIAPRIAGIPELVEDKVCGLLFHPGNSDDLTLKLEALFEDEQLRRQLGARGSQFVKSDFASTQELDRLVRIMEARLSGHPAPIRPSPVEQVSKLASRSASRDRFGRKGKTALAGGSCSG
jgi:colanic acid/amylovoran biosynthesis glycosyltransferase